MAEHCKRRICGHENLQDIFLVIYLNYGLIDCTMVGGFTAEDLKKETKKKRSLHCMEGTRIYS